MVYATELPQLCSLCQLGAVNCMFPCQNGPLGRPQEQYTTNPSGHPMQQGLLLTVDFVGKA